MIRCDNYPEHIIKSSTEQIKKHEKQIKKKKSCFGMSTSESWPFPSAHVVARFWQQPFKKWSKISQLCPSLIIIYEKCPIEVLAAKWDFKITFKSLFTFSSLHCEWFLSLCNKDMKCTNVLVLSVKSCWHRWRSDRILWVIKLKRAHKRLRDIAWSSIWRTWVQSWQSIQMTDHMQYDKKIRKEKK